MRKLKLLLFCVSSYVTICPMNNVILNWIKTSDYDIVTANSMFKAKRYVYVIFFCHLSIEKSLKAVVCKITKKIPPKTHDLFLLLKLADIALPEKHQLLIAHLNTASIPTRYPEDIVKITEQYNRTAAEKYLKQAKDFLKWLKQNQKLTG